jgi:hypothetical protein
MIQAIPPDYCRRHELNHYAMPLTVSDRFRGPILTAKSYLGTFDNVQSVQKIMLEKRCPNYQYVIWEHRMKNPNTRKEVRIMMASYNRDYHRFKHVEFTINAMGQFVILHYQRLPGEQRHFYLPLVHFPTFHRVVDLLLYLEFIWDFGDYHYPKDFETMFKMKPLSPYNKYKNTGITGVRSLQNLCACLLHCYYIDDIWELRMPHHPPIPMKLFRYIQHCDTYLMDDVKYEEYVKKCEELRKINDFKGIVV